MQLHRLVLDRRSLRLQQLMLGDVIPLVNLGIVVSQFTWGSEERRPSVTSSAIVLFVRFPRAEQTILSFAISARFFFFFFSFFFFFFFLMKNSTFAENYHANAPLVG
jgi:hypothetical protein